MTKYERVSYQLIQIGSTSDILASFFAGDAGIRALSRFIISSCFESEFRVNGCPRKTRFIFNLCFHLIECYRLAKSFSEAAHLTSEVGPAVRVIRERVEVDRFSCLGF